LVYLRARWYNPSDGRFQSRDTWGGEDNNPITMNRWAYANANPVMNTDPTGYSAQSSLVLIINNQANKGISSIFQNFGSNPCNQWDQVAMAGGVNAFCLNLSAGNTICDFWLGFAKEAYRVHIWFNPTPSVQRDVAIKNNESSSMLLGRLTADIVSIGAARAEVGGGNLLIVAAAAECVAGELVAGVGGSITCPDAALKAAGGLILAGQGAMSGSIAVVDGVQVLAMLSGRNGGGSNRRPPGFTSKWKKEGKKWIDPKTGNKWYFHAEDSNHYDHWDVYFPGGGQDRIAIDPSKGVFKPR